jgi:EAL domain-containing protein (putative c-di-GMP-specific phosphodiesterase class I)
MAVNVSPRSLETPRVCTVLAEQLERHQVSGRQVRIELTEHSLLSDAPALQERLGELRKLGVRFGVDDFGTGYSALAYLQRFDLDFMKVDRSFVTPVADDARSRAVVSAVIDLAHAHDMVVTAEGVETAEQAEVLRDMGCDLAQGWHFGRPGPVELLADP